MNIEFTESQLSMISSSLEQSIKTMREDKAKVSLIASLAIQSGMNDFDVLKKHLMSGWISDSVKGPA